MRPSTKMNQWQRTQNANESERERLTFLRTAPLPKNDPAIMRLVKVRVTRAAFCIGGKQVQVDSIIVMPLHEARDMESLHKVEFVE